MSTRSATIERRTRETDVKLTLDLEGAKQIIGNLIAQARASTDHDYLYPFEEAAIDAIPPKLRETPRTLIRTCHELVELASIQGIPTITRALVDSFAQGTTSQPPSA